MKSNKGKKFYQLNVGIPDNTEGGEPMLDEFYGNLKPMARRSAKPYLEESILVNGRTIARHRWIELMMKVGAEVRLTVYPSKSLLEALQGEDPGIQAVNAVYAMEGIEPGIKRTMAEWMEIEDISPKMEAVRAYLETGDGEKLLDAGPSYYRKEYTLVLAGDEIRTMNKSEFDYFRFLLGA